MAKRELEESVQRELTVDDCPYRGCGQHFYSSLNREAHQKLNPTHFTTSKTDVEVKEDVAVTQDLKGKITKAKKHE